MEVAKRSLIGRKCKCAQWHVKIFFSSLSAIFAHCYCSTIYIMALKEAYLATELDRARGRNLDDSNLAALIADHFALDDLEASSNDGDAGKPLCFIGE